MAAVHHTGPIVDQRRYTHAFLCQCGECDGLAFQCGAATEPVAESSETVVLLLLHEKSGKALKGHSLRAAPATSATILRFYPGCFQFPESLEEIGK
jgi:hypothetical protein